MRAALWPVAFISTLFTMRVRLTTGLIRWGLANGFEGVFRLLAVLRQVQPYPDRHEPAGQPNGRRDRLMKKNGRNERTDERGRRKISARPRGPDVPETDNEANQAKPVGNEPKAQGPGKRAEAGRRCAQARREAHV